MAFPKHTPSERPIKPWPEFPLFPHSTGRWAKKIGGKMHYFGPWNDPEGAYNRYLARQVNEKAVDTSPAPSKAKTDRSCPTRSRHAAMAWVSAFSPSIRSVGQEDSRQNHPSKRLPPPPDRTRKIPVPVAAIRRRRGLSFFVRRVLL